MTDIDGTNELKNKITNSIFHDDNFEVFSNINIDITNLMNKLSFKMSRLCRLMRFELKRRINIYIVDDPEDFKIVNPTFGWCVGLSLNDDAFILQPKHYKGNLYPNVLLHECIHCLIYQIFGIQRYNLKYEEGFAVLFSTPLLDWKRELMKEENLHYLFEAEHLQKIYIEKGMDGVLEEMTSEMTLKEEYIIDLENQRVCPIYLFLLSGNSTFSSKIKKFTKSKYSHSGLSLDLTFDKIFSYNLHTYDGGSGFSIESLKDYSNDYHGKDFEIKIMVTYIPERNFRMLKERIKWYKEHKAETKYNVFNIFKIVFGSAIKKVNDLNMICSTFVACILNFCGYDLGVKDPTLITPEDINRLENENKIRTLFEGKYSEFNMNSLRGKLTKIKRDTIALNEDSKSVNYIDVD